VDRTRRELAVHPDRTSARIELPEDPVEVFFEPSAQGGPDGPARSVVLSRSEAAALVEARRARLETLRVELKREASQSLRGGLRSVFAAAADDRVPVFADWYFAYKTTYVLLAEAMRAAAAHQTPFSSTRGGGHGSTREAVAARLSERVLSKYEAVVLRPELNDAPLQDAFRGAARGAHAEFVRSAAEADEALRAALRAAREKAARERAPHGGGGAEASLPSPGVEGEATAGTGPAAPRAPRTEPRAPRIELLLDWRSHRAKARHVPAAVERQPFEVTAALSLGGAVAGKVLAGTVAKAATTGMVSKLTAPFVAKAVAGAAAGGAGAAAGAVGGPGGAVVGALAGVAVDAAVNAVHGRLHRDEFVREVREVLRASEAQFAAVLERELDRAVDEWVDRAVAGGGGL
jgi:hypothetical protein